MMKRFLSSLLACLILSMALLGCQSADSSNSSDSDSAAEQASGETITVNFWSAPQKVQYDFWVDKAEEFNKQKIDYNGKTIQVKVQQMPESPSSEAGIQNSIVTGTAPAISENISRSFAATLAQSGVIYDLQDEDWFKDIVSEKKIEDIIKGWEIDSKQYVIPEYVNPITWQWNAKALKALGFTQVPQTVEDLENVLKAFTEKRKELSAIGVTHTLYRPALVRADQWWERWFDFQMSYMALTGKTSWVENDKLTLDREGTIDTFELFGKFGNTIQTSEVTDLWTGETTPVLLSPSAPWEIQALEEAGKSYGMDGDYVYGPSLVKNEGDTPYNFGDSKGIVLYKNSNITEDQHNGAVAFIKWVYSDENCTQTDVDWLKATTMLPVRGDIADNDAFAQVIDSHPALKDLVEYSKYSIPCMASDKITDIQTKLGEEGICPYIEKAKEQPPLNAPDASEYVDAAFEAMKSAGNLS
ncbi:MAG: Extracellular solute-binding protein [Clostridium sp.]|jgi:multiple sugar transport system substrate-binding protein